MRNRNKLNRQRLDISDLSDMQFEPIEERVSGMSQTFMNTFTHRDNLLTQSFNGTSPFGIRDNNISMNEPQNDSMSKRSSKIEKVDKFEAIGLASKLIMSILEATETDEATQASILDE